MIDPDFDPLRVLDEITHEVVRLGGRQIKTEEFIQELAKQNNNIANHLASQADELSAIYNELGKILNEVKQGSSNDRQRRP